MALERDHLNQICLQISLMPQTGDVLAFACQYHPKSAREGWFHLTGRFRLVTIGK
jgi:hypothetical protein